MRIPMSNIMDSLFFSIFTTFAIRFARASVVASGTIISPRAIWILHPNISVWINLHIIGGTSSYLLLN